MKFNKFFILPIVFLIITIITSILAFSYDAKLENGYFYSSELQKEIVIEGEYFAVFGNLGQESQTISLVDMSDGIHITIKDGFDVILKDYMLVIKEYQHFYDPSIISSINEEPDLQIDNLDGYLFTVNLESLTTYQVNLSETVDNIDEDQIEIVLVNISEELLLTKTIYEIVSYTSLVLFVVSSIVVSTIIYKRRFQ